MALQLTGTTTALGVVVASTLAAGLYFGITQSGGHTRVLGEKFVGTGASTNGQTSGASNAGGNGNGNGNGSNPAKTFGIGGTLSGVLYPGSSAQLLLTTTNPLNQDMTVQSLTASLTSITKASGRSGTCSPTVTIGSWTGSAFLLPKNSSKVAPGYIPISLGAAATDACQGATFNLRYAGTAAG